MINEIEITDSLIKVTLVPVDILPSDDDLVRVWVPMVIEDEEEGEEEQVAEEDPDIDEDFDDESDLDEDEEEEDEDE